MVVPIRFSNPGHGEPISSYHWVVKQVEETRIEMPLHFVKKGYAEELQESDFDLGKLGGETLSHLLF